MEFRRLTEQLSVAPQVTPENMPAIAAAGFKTILCNRPDGEADDQPTFAAIKEAAIVCGLTFINQPVSPKKATNQDVTGFANNVAAAQSPVLAYCRTGTRCTILWALGNSAEGMPIEKILKIAADAGYDLSKQAHYIAAAGQGAAND